MEIDPMPIHAEEVPHGAASLASIKQPGQGWSFDRPCQFSPGFSLK